MSRRRLSLQPTQAAAPPRTHRLLLLGSGSVGKTQLLNRLLSLPFQPHHHRTVEELHALTSPSLQLEILDTAGSYEFPAMRTLNIRNADGFLVVFDVADGATLEEASSLIDLIHSSKPAQPRITIAANKCDSLPPADLDLLANSPLYSRLQSDYNLLRTSALTGEGCERLWETVVGDLGGGGKLRRVSVGEVEGVAREKECVVQ